MKALRLSVLTTFIVGLLALAACSPPPTPDPAEISRRAEATIVAQTQVAELVEIAAAAANRQTYLPNLPTASFPPQAPLPTATPLTAEGQSPAIPRETTPPTAVPGTVQSCYRAQFVSDVTVSDNTSMQPGQAFVKTWRLMNAGSCPWTPDTQLVYVEGAAMQGMSAPLGQTIEPGQSVDLSVQLTAPADPGTYRGQWMLANASGRFGLGDSGNQPFWVQILVQAPGLAGSMVYNFAEQACDASWRTAVAELACPSEPYQPIGFVVPVGKPLLENRKEDELGIWTNPNQGDGNWIAGTYPPYLVQPGDHFIADIGCVADRPGCNLDFRLAYRPTSDESQLEGLGAWSEVYDGKLQRIDVDLSGLAGQQVRLILAVAGLGPPDQNAAFWLAPQIRR